VFAIVRQLAQAERSPVIKEQEVSTL
jgi:hypothetical protein